MTFLPINLFGLRTLHLPIPSSHLVPLTARPLQGSFLASSLSTNIGSILFVFSRLLVLAGRQDRLRCLEFVYPSFSGKENKMSGIFIDSAQTALLLRYSWMLSRVRSNHDRFTYWVEREGERKERETKRKMERERGGDMGLTCLSYSWKKLIEERLAVQINPLRWVPQDTNRYETTYRVQQLSGNYMRKLLKL